MVSALKVEGLGFAYPDGRQVLFGVDFSVQAGERVALLGPNGAGKTTLVLHLNGMLGAVAGDTGTGTIEVAGLRLDRGNLREIRRRVGLVFQNPDDQLFMPNVRRDVGFGPANLGLSDDEVDARVTAALAEVDMSDALDRAPFHLSFGQKRRVALAGVLALQPEILVFDEPSSNLDPAARSQLSVIIERLGLATLMVTHDLPYAAQLCSRCLLMDEGRIIADRPTADLLTDTALLAAHRLELPYGFQLPR